MSLFRVRLALRAPLGTPLTSGTLFGHLCWAKREAEGETALAAWLAALPEAPWALSDGFPAGWLPRPLLRREPAGRPSTMTRERLRELEQAKRQRKLPWIEADQWARLRQRLSAPLIDACATASPTLDQRLAHNTIDRLTGATPEEGGLFFVDEDWSHAEAPGRDVYVRAETSAGALKDLFAAVGEAGFGRDATWGRGQFAVEGVEDAGWLDDHAGNRLLSLSHGCLSANMQRPRYRLFTHYGKIGAGLLADGVRPWKYPILVMRPGASFAPADAGPFGAWLAGVHQDRAEVGHNAFHLAIPFTETGAEP